MSGPSGRAEILDLYFRLVRPRRAMRILELGTDTENALAAATALLAAAHPAATLVSVADEPAVTRAARAGRPTGGRIEFRTGPTAAGWPASAPYDLVLHVGPPPQRLPKSWVSQCAPLGQLVTPIWLRDAGSHPWIGLIGITIGTDGAPLPRPRLMQFELTDQGVRLDYQKAQLTEHPDGYTVKPPAAPDRIKPNRPQNRRKDPRP